MKTVTTMPTIWTSYYLVTTILPKPGTVGTLSYKIASSSKPGAPFIVSGLDANHLKRVLSTRSEPAINAFCDYVQHAHRGKVVTAGF